MAPSFSDRVCGVIYGQAIGDALGFGTECLSKADAVKVCPNGLADYAQITRFPKSDQWRRGNETAFPTSCSAWRHGKRCTSSTACSRPASFGFKRNAV